MLNRLFRRKPSNPGRELALIGAQKRKADRRAKVRDMVDQMRRDMGLPEVDWGNL